MHLPAIQPFSESQTMCFALPHLLAALCLAPGQAPSTNPRDIAFTADFDGSTQRYVVMEPVGLQPSTPVSILIALHGHGSDRWQFIRDPRAECKAARDCAAKHRMVFVSPDYRAKTSWMGPAAEADMVQILRELRKKYNVRNILISGGSMGGTGALTFAALHPEWIDGVVSLNGTANLVEYDQFQEAIAASFGGSKTAKPEEYRKRSAEMNAGQLTMPIACTTGGRDKLVPPDSVARLVTQLQKQNRPAHLIHRPEGGHDTNYADATEALEWVLARVATQHR